MMSEAQKKAELNAIDQPVDWAYLLQKVKENPSALGLFAEFYESQSWTSVKKSLPPDRQKVLVWILDWESKIGKVEFGYFNKVGSYWTIRSFQGNETYIYVGNDGLIAYWRPMLKGPNQEVVHGMDVATGKDFPIEIKTPFDHA